MVRSDDSARGDAVSALIVDDDHDGREMMGEALRRAGYTIRTACDGLDALEVLRAFRPALILLDIHMPTMDGRHFRQLQRQDPDLVGIPTIVMTSDMTFQPLPDMSSECTVRKPLTVRKLLALVATHAAPVAA